MLPSLPHCKAEASCRTPNMRDWPHSPAHRLDAAGAYMVTAGTRGKQCFFRSPELLDLLCDSLLALAPNYGWQLQAWAVLANHYHFIALSPAKAEALRPFIRHLHSITAREINRIEGTGGRKIWFQYWDTHLTYEKSYFARLNYVHRNAVHHSLVRVPSAYPWCSASWFEARADPAFYSRIMSMPSDRLNIPDDY